MSLRGPKCSKKVHVTPLHPHSSLNYWYRRDWFMLSCSLCQILVLLFECCTYETRQKSPISSLLLSDFGVPVQTVSSVFLFKLTEVALGFVLLLLFICFICYCAFWNALLHSLVVRSGYLRRCCLPVSSKQSGHSPLISDIRKLSLTGYLWESKLNLCGTSTNATWKVTKGDLSSPF